MAKEFGRPSEGCPDCDGDMAAAAVVLAELEEECQKELDVVR